MILFAVRCNSQGLGSGLLSILTEGFPRTTLAPAPEPTPKEAQEEFKSNAIDLERFAQVEQRKEPESSLLGTLNLSYAGNMDFSEALTMASRVGSSLAQAIGSLVDLKFVRNVVDIAVDRLNEVDGREGRSDNKMARLERIKDGITEAVGAALGEQECWQRTACRIGEVGTVRERGERDTP